MLLFGDNKMKIEIIIKNVYKIKNQICIDIIICSIELEPNEIMFGVNSIGKG